MRSLLGTTTFALFTVVAATSRAGDALGTSTASAPGADATLHRITGGVGLSALQAAAYGGDGRDNYNDHRQVAVDLGYAYRVGSHFEVGGQLGWVRSLGAGLDVIRPAASMRVFVAPASGLELGASVKVGPMIGASPAQSWLGAWVGASVDARLWLGRTGGVFMQADAWAGGGRTLQAKRSTYDNGLGMLALPSVSVGWIARF